MTDIGYWLALLRAPGIGPSTFATLLDHFKSPRAVFESGAAARRACGLLGAPALDYVQKPDWDTVEHDLAWLAQPGRAVLTLLDAAYPALLREISDPPPLLFVHGDASCLAEAQLAIVGSRNPTPTGGETAFAFARHLAGAGLTITSGLALGIDAAGHRGALAGGGRTVAVLGCGLDRIYPVRHRELAQEIAARGAVISEYPPGTAPLPQHFPRRNRIISGLSLGTLVVEAALRSGSLITARCAAEQGREVFAIPGSIHNPLARGCHALLRQGAKLVETAQDILEELGPLAFVAATASEEVAEREEFDGEYRKILESLGFEPTSIDTLVERTGLTAEAVSSMLLILELRGHIASAAGGLYSRASKENPR